VTYEKGKKKRTDISAEKFSGKKTSNWGGAPYKGRSSWLKTGFVGKKSMVNSE